MMPRQKSCINNEIPSKVRGIQAKKLNKQSNKSLQRQQRKLNFVFEMILEKFEKYMSDT